MVHIWQLMDVHKVERVESKGCGGRVAAVRETCTGLLMMEASLGAVPSGFYESKTKTGTRDLIPLACRL